MNINDMFERIAWIVRFTLTSIEIKWPILLFESIFLIGGIMLVITGIKIRRQSMISAIMNVVLGSVITLSTLYLLFVTFLFGYNS
ncbi:hypothetical protein [Alkalibacterium olivapovliticus]|uniref:Uncharacterized protein n=1 Tax=Alkalibacterium olivapovliticus TaxID=99907 RepID=A0A2T0VWR8_9LACT|nr:hypothetical protein [Alkalibacterium olivapovliticus]PRY76190.1 hypothetical protein CLV38_13221 [Alkalibacterium olivapovliticus]